MPPNNKYESTKGCCVLLLRLALSLARAILAFESKRQRVRTVASAVLSEQS